MLALLLIFASFSAPRQAFAAGTVGNGSPGSCTEEALRKAISGGGRVTFNCGPNPVTITLNNEIEIKKANVEIDGGGKITLSGGRRTRMFWVYAGTLTVRNLTFRDGYSEEGGAIRSAGESTIKIYGSKFFNNDGTKSWDVEDAGAISMHTGVLHVENSHFEGNRGVNGGAIYNLLCDVTIINSKFINNDSTKGGVPGNNWPGDRGFGGAIYTDGASALGDNVGGKVVIRNSTFIGNKASTGGGAIYTYLYSPDTSLIEGSYFENNTVLLSKGGKANGGALMHHQGSLTLRNSTFVGNRSEEAGGAVVIYQNSSDSAWNNSTVTNVTITNNRADAFNSNLGRGGGLFISGGIVEIRNSTIAGNWADGRGAGLFVSGDHVRLYNTIIANNTISAQDPHVQCNRTFSGSNNIQSAGSGTKCANGVTLADPKLAGVAKNGGRTPTMALQAGSPAIDRGSNCPSTDQRGATRVGQCDIGAFEYGSSAPSPDGLVAPTLQELSANGGPAVRVAWGAVPGAVYYELQAAPTSSLADEAPTLAANEASATLVLDVGSYTVRVRSCNEEGCSPYSDPRSVSVSVAPEKVFLSQILR